MIFSLELIEMVIKFIEYSERCVVAVKYFKSILFLKKDKKKLNEKGEKKLTENILAEVQDQ